MGDACIRQRKQPLRPQKSSTKLLPLVLNAFDSANSPCGPEIFKETDSTGDACIRQRKQPLRPQKSSTKLFALVTHAFDSANSPCGLRNLQRNCFHWSRMDSTAQTSPAASEIFNETASSGDACIRQRKQPVRHQKSSTKLIPLVTHGFDSANTHSGLRNHQRNCFHG